mmetsp:Transcript_20095/g.43263  ORF Transcript_20095/g.43263 Transcript_20095/m.43263 type:complete len:289 (-) Transcript_20095:7154-8020(-)
MTVLMEIIGVLIAIVCSHPGSVVIVLFLSVFRLFYIGQIGQWFFTLLRFDPASQRGYLRGFKTSGRCVKVNVGTCSRVSTRWNNGNVPMTSVVAHVALEDEESVGRTLPDPILAVLAGILKVSILMICSINLFHSGVFNFDLEWTPVALASLTILDIITLGILILVIRVVSSHIRIRVRIVNSHHFGWVCYLPLSVPLTINNALTSIWAHGAIVQLSLKGFPFLSVSSHPFEYRSDFPELLQDIQISLKAPTVMRVLARFEEDELQHIQKTDTVLNAATYWCRTEHDQ